MESISEGWRLVVLFTPFTERSLSMEMGRIKMIGDHLMNQFSRRPTAIMADDTDGALSSAIELVKTMRSDPDDMALYDNPISEKLLSIKESCFVVSAYQDALNSIVYRYNDLVATKVDTFTGPGQVALVQIKSAENIQPRVERILFPCFARIEITSPLAMAQA